MRTGSALVEASASALYCRGAFNTPWIFDMTSTPHIAAKPKSRGGQHAQADRSSVSVAAATGPTPAQLAAAIRVLDHARKRSVQPPQRSGRALKGRP